MQSPDKANKGQSQRHRYVRCPVCRRIVNVPEQGPPKSATFFPFCSDRCKLIDLGAWLDAEYRIPSRPDEESDRPPAKDFGASEEDS